MRQILALLFCALLLTACGPKVQPPNEAVNEAFRTLDSLLVMERNETEHLADLDHSITDFKVVRAEPLSGSATKWCIGIEYLAANMRTEEINDYGFVQFLEQAGNGWQSQPMGDIAFFTASSPRFDGLWRDCMSQ